MIFVTGDCHGNFERFKPEYFPEQAQMTKRDIVICAGDFGGVWFGDGRDEAALDWLESLPFTLAFVCGNHENYDALERYPVKDWHGGKVHRIRSHVLHLMRGQVFELEGYHFFTMGGAKSHDTEDGILEPGAPDFERKLLMLQRKPRARYRINHISWWAQEMPSEEEYSTMFATLESVMKADLPQMELYCEIGKAVCAHSEKGAAVAAAEFIKEQYPDMTGFSPRNVRRMRDFWQLYSGTPELLGEALHLNWTQNVVIMEAELPAEERRWYIRQATARNLSKAELLRMIEDSAYLESVLDEKVDVWYNEGNDEISERTQYEEDPVYLSWQYLPQPHGRVRDEGLGKKGGTGIAISYRISGYQSGGDRQPSLSSGTAQAGRAWDLLRRPCRTAVDKSGLRRIRSPDRHGPGQPPGYVPYLRRRLCRQDVPPDGSHRPSRQCGRPMVHRGLRGDLAGCAGWLPRTFERIHDRTR